LRPPFVAADLQSLYKKVCAGMFERIPMMYSGELANVIGSLLKVDPNKRPDTDELLASNVVRKRYNGEYDNSQGGEDDFD
jgi:serine/threonine protein kinase